MPAMSTCLTLAVRYLRGALVLYERWAAFLALSFASATWPQLAPAHAAAHVPAAS